MTFSLNERTVDDADDDTTGIKGAGAFPRSEKGDRITTGLSFNEARLKPLTKEAINDSGLGKRGRRGKDRGSVFRWSELERAAAQGLGRPAWA